MDTTPPHVPVRTGPIDFTLPAPTVDALLFCFDALTMTVPTHVSKILLSPRKPKAKPGPRKKPLSSISGPYKFAEPVVTPSRQRKSFTTIFKFEVLAWWNRAQIQDGLGNERSPNRLEVCARYGLKDVRYLNRWEKGLNLNPCDCSLYVILRHRANQ